MTDFTSPPQSILPATSERIIKSKLQYYADIHLWPEQGLLDPSGWLSNFTDTERPFALNLLNVFLYFNEPLVNALFHRAVHELSSILTLPSISLSAARNQWRSFLNRVLVTYVEGEVPNPTDSGLVFAWKARKVLGIGQAQIKPPGEALSSWLKGRNRPILLVDDFVGSGTQMDVAWRREHSFAGNDTLSLAVAAERGAEIHYVPLVATTYGLGVLAKNCVHLQVHPVHVLDERYSLTHSSSILWPDSLRSEAMNFLEEASRRAGILGASDDAWKGFCGLALAIAFSHSIPDATLPLYSWERPGWLPLIRRT